MENRMRNGSISRSRRRGFTFVELMVVISIIVILITISIPIYNNVIRRANESVLKNNLFTMRTVIDNYTGDKGKAPASLQERRQQREPGGARHLRCEERFRQGFERGHALLRMVAARSATLIFSCERSGRVVWRLSF